MRLHHELNAPVLAYKQITSYCIYSYKLFKLLLYNSFLLKGYKLSMKSLHSHRDNTPWKYIHKNISLLSGIAAVFLTIVFVSTVIISGKSAQLGKVDKSSAAGPVVKFQDATCSSAIVSTSLPVTGSYTVTITNGSGDLVSQSNAFNFIGETTYITFPTLGSSDYFSFVLNKNGVTFGTHSPYENYRFNLVCPPPNITFSQHTCSSVQVATSEALSGTYQVGVAFSNGGERDRPTQFINRSKPFTFNGQSANTSFDVPLNSNDDFYYSLLKNNVMVGKVVSGSPKTLECYNPETTAPTRSPSPTPSPSPQGSNTAPVGHLDGVYNTSSLGWVISGWTMDPDSVTEKLKVHVYVDKEYSTSDTSGYVDEVIANSSRSDLTGNYANHAFNWIVPAKYKDGVSHTYYFYPIDYPTNTGFGIPGGKALSLGKITHTFTNDAIACSNKDIMLVIDTSGSMSGNKIADAKAGVKALISKLPSSANARAGLVGFGSHAYSVADMTTTMSKVSDSVDKLRASGGTNLAEGISLGSSKIAADNRTHVMLIMTDGVANLPRDRNVGPNDPAAYVTAQAAATQAVASEISRGLRTVFYSVGLGNKSQLNSTWLDTLAQGTGGKSVYVSKSADIDNKFTELVTEMCKETPASAGDTFLRNLGRLNAPKL